VKILSVVGARPQFVKAFPLSRALRERHEEVLVHTGQHYDEALSAVFFEELSIPKPDHNLGVGSGDHAHQTAAMMTGIADLVEQEQPDLVLVYGDTNSTLAGALVAAKTAPDLAHVEAGLRSHNRAMPEEINRLLTDHSADLLFAPTRAAARNLRDEGLYADVHQTGDVMYDAILASKGNALASSEILEELDLEDEAYVLATVHRASNTDNPDRLRSIFEALGSVEERVVIPLHPRTKAALERENLLAAVKAGVDVIDPVGYLDFVRLLASAERVATDSGGVQKEAFYLDRPCVTLREETEWVELVECGWNRLVGADPDAIQAALTAPIDLPIKPSLYGDGDAAGRIVAAIDDHAETGDAAAADRVTESQGTAHRPSTLQSE
jgi:UDP-N-acetylglucosamine 2-epimerase (non-hydrolysing)